MNVKKFYDLWRDDLKRSGFNKTSTNHELASIIMHFYNMGGLDDEEYDEAIKLVYDDRLFKELKELL